MLPPLTTNLRQKSYRCNMIFSIFVFACEKMCFVLEGLGYVGVVLCLGNLRVENKRNVCGMSTCLFHFYVWKSIKIKWVHD